MSKRALHANKTHALSAQITAGEALENQPENRPLDQ